MSAHAAGSAHLDREPSRRAETEILIVEDEPRLRQLACLELSRTGYRVSAVASAREALARLAKQSFALVLSDYAMPDGDGLALLVRVQRLRPDLPFVLWSASLPGGVQRQARELGAATSEKLLGEKLSALVEALLEPPVERGSPAATPTAREIDRRRSSRAA